MHNAEPGDGEGGEHDGQVRFDGFTLPTRHGPYARTYATDADHEHRLVRKSRPPKRLSPQNTGPLSAQPVILA
jgi:hypothetical protein